jgi:hypothetical protein
MCLSCCLSCLHHYSPDPLSLGLFSFLQCFSSLPLPLSFTQTRLDKPRSKDRQDSTRPAQTSPPKSRTHTSPPAFSSRLSASRFACPTRYDDLASSSEDEDGPSSPVCSQLSMPADPFSALRAPPPTVSFLLSCLVRSCWSACHCPLAFRVASSISSHP